LIKKILDIFKRLMA